MKSLRSRILWSYVIFGVIIFMLALFSYNFLREADNVRVIQNDILDINNQVLTLMDLDVAIRTEGLYDSSFFSDASFPDLLSRNNHYNIVQKSIKKVSEISSSPATIQIARSLDSISFSLLTYNILYQELLEMMRRRGFRDEGLEGTMRSYAHALENYQETIKLERLLSLRRREKDYFLRGDPMYVMMLNKECKELLEELDTTQESDQEVLVLLQKYQASFNEIVQLEAIIGSLSSGLLQKVSQQKNTMLEDLSLLAEHVNGFSNRRINGIFNQLLVLLLAGLLLASVVGIASANLASSSINSLAKSMRKALKSNFKTPLAKPSKWSTVETKSLYKDYGKLHRTIRQQLEALEGTNKKLKKNNKSLNELIELLRESEDRLRESNELKDKFFSIIAHDLKGPMATNTQMLEFMNLQTDELSKEDITQYTKKLHQTSSSILALLDNLLQWASSQSEMLKLHKETFDVYEVLDSILNLNKQHIEDKALTFENKVPVNTGIYADKNMMEFVFRNLIDNAIKYTPNKGSVMIDITIEKEMIYFRVSDTGIGITEEEMTQLFTSLSKKQTRGTNGEKGIGLGLVLAYDFVQKNGGRLEVSSRLNEGSTFQICIPYKPLDIKLSYPNPTKFTQNSEKVAH